MGWAEHVARMVARKGVYWVLVRKPEGKRPPGRPRRRWENNIKMVRQGKGCGSIGWIDLAQDRNKGRGLVNVVMNHQVS